MHEELLYKITRPYLQKAELSRSLWGPLPEVTKALETKVLNPDQCASEKYVLIAPTKTSETWINNYKQPLFL